MRHTQRQLPQPDRKPPRSHSLRTAVAHVEAGSAFHLQSEPYLAWVRHLGALRAVAVASDVRRPSEVLAQSKSAEVDFTDVA